MRHRLKLHPDSRCDAVTGIEVELARHPDDLVMCYFVAGNMSEVCLPSVTAPSRADKLWQHTCFEAFVRASPGGTYWEFNFAPSTQWAAYRFDSYRSGMRVADEIAAPSIATHRTAVGYELQVSLKMRQLPALADDATWFLGFSAVIEEAGGRTSYWALAHPSGKADFHHSDCFVLELPAALRP